MWQRVLTWRPPGDDPIPGHPEPPAWQAVVDRRAALRRWGQWTAVPLVLLVLVPAVAGYALGGWAARPYVRAQTAVADRAADRPGMPPAAVPPFFAERSPTPTAQPPGDARVLIVPGLPIVFAVPASWPGECTVLEAPGAGSGRAYAWTCDDDRIQVLIAACDPDCSPVRRVALRPDYLPESMTPGDPSTWYAHSETGEGMEHVWSAPPGVLTPAAPAQELYVAVLVRVGAAATPTVARKVVADLRHRM
ncbi:MAG: hypothetical protein HOV76_29595 [Hamadaea sp.]|nr:hypothetical protein [Hamadaea sp.]